MSFVNCVSEESPEGRFLKVLMKEEYSKVVFLFSFFFNLHGRGHIIFLGLLRRKNINWVAYNNSDLSAHSFGGQESETRVWTGPLSL